jgi:hypothetical protein
VLKEAESSSILRAQRQPKKNQFFAKKFFFHFFLFQKLYLLDCHVEITSSSEIWYVLMSHTHILTQLDRTAILFVVSFFLLGACTAFILDQTLSMYVYDHGKSFVASTSSPLPSPLPLHLVCERLQCPLLLFVFHNTDIFCQ